MIETMFAGIGKDLGGFRVARVLPALARRAVGPFVFLDHMGPAVFPPGGGIDVRPHPHIGLATVTWLFEGRILHRDSLGTIQAIAPGEVNWMSAGSGIVHSERTEPELRAAGWRLHGMQAWIALPDGREDDPPAFVHVPADALPGFTRDGAAVRLIAGSGWGLEAPVPMASPLIYAEARLEPGARLTAPDGHAERAVYVAQGRIAAAGAGDIAAGRLAVLAPGAEAVVEAGPEGALVMVLGGAPVGPRRLEWNFVASTGERIAAAKAAWRARAMPMPPGETERIEWPGDAEPA